MADPHGGAPPTLPIDAVLDELEDIAAAAAAAGAPLVRGWAADVVLRMGVTSGVAAEYLLSLLDRWSAKPPDRHAHLLSSATYALVEWKKTCSRPSASRAVDVDQMYQVIRSGRLKLWLEKLRSHLGVLVGAREGR